MPKKLYDLAKAAQKNSYSPYSKYRVSAALLADNNKTYIGVNVENASYGGTICAERSAIVSAISDGAQKVNEIVIYTNEKKPWPPCGLCLQVMSEFMSESSKVHLANADGIQKTYALNDLLPQAFKL